MNCKDKGYREGEVFKIIDGHYGKWSGGAIAVLSEADTSAYACIHPRFDLIEGECGHRNGKNGVRGAFTPLSDVKRIWPPENNTVSIEVDGQKTEISIESARALKKMLEGI